MRWVKQILLFLLIVFILPALAHAGLWIAKPRPSSWSTADWSSANILPKSPPMETSAIYIFSARTGGLKGAFSTHSWIVTKQAGSQNYNRYDVVGWGQPVRKNMRAPDGKWYSNQPTIHYQMQGEAAQKLIPIVEDKIANYRWRNYGDYTVWPGPNSNTFVSTILSQLPQLKTSTPATAVGRDFPTSDEWVSFENGVLRVTLGGYAGVVVGKGMGLELNFLGLVAGANHSTGEIKIPAFGTYSLI